MSIVSLLASILYFVFLLYFFIMWARFVLDLVRTFNRSWRPQGPGLVAVEAVYSVTDPPIRFFRRIMPKMQVGAVAFDFGWSITMLVVIIGMYIFSALRYT